MDSCDLVQLVMIEKQPIETMQLCVYLIYSYYTVEYWLASLLNKPEDTRSNSAAGRFLDGTLSVRPLLQSNSNEIQLAQAFHSARAQSESHTCNTMLL